MVVLEVVLAVGEGGDVDSILVSGAGAGSWVGAWCGGWVQVVGVVEGYCCFLVIERILEGRGELEFVVEGVDGDE